jgi:hypothetical protein
MRADLPGLGGPGVGMAMYRAESHLASCTSCIQYGIHSLEASHSTGIDGREVFALDLARDST